jgi:hypothetical protein
MLKTTEENQNLDKNSEVVTDQINIISEEQPDSIFIDGEEPKKYEEINKKKVELTPEQRIEVLQELSVLQSLINTTYYLAKLDQGNKGKQEKKITGSVSLNFFPNDQMNKWGNRIIELSNLL